MRSVLKEQVSDSKVRSKLLYDVLNNDSIKEALSKGNLEEAQKLAMKFIEMEK